MAFAVTNIEALQIESRPPLRDMYKLSPFVWREQHGYDILIRAVPHSDNPAEKIARVYHGRSQDGVRFVMGDEPVIAPGPDEHDVDGCEDPTLAIVDGTYYVYYSGWNERLKRGQLLLACGPNVEHLEKRGVALTSSPQCQNPKEATIVRAADGSWRLFFEYASEGASKIGVAVSDDVAGPWRVEHSPFEAREDRWDSWHLSTGPVCDATTSPVMFYNGASRKTEWRIGWITFDECYHRTSARCTDPLLAPPAKRGPEDTDIAFASSAVDDGTTIRLYYSIADKDMYCALIRRV
jgi:beta-1,2-mannobiose phosphorylase / 1,2-beta-oligomannan phosphorylase